MAILERGAGTKLFTISSLPAYKDVSTVQADAGSWPAPSLVLLGGTVLGAADFLEF